MTGWRVVCSGDPEIIGAMASGDQPTTSNWTTVSHAAIEALTETNLLLRAKL